MTESNTKLCVHVKKVGEIAQAQLSIPDYQRPYKWQHRHVMQLLQDLQHHYEKQQDYRLGTLVIHQHGNRSNIVDGQQRLITLSLLLACLSQDSRLSLLAAEFHHHTSISNIQSNYLFIKRHLSEQTTLNQAEFAAYILQQCELVWVELDNLEEAFQFFDSQNARGKKLEPYDLLKAFHLREIPADHPRLMSYVENWEQAVNEDPTLKIIISQTLFRLRQWQRQQSADSFENDHLPVFKGVGEQCTLPFLQAQRAGIALYQAQQLNPMMYSLYTAPPFQIQQTIFNGQWFFEFIAHYRQKHRELFDERTGLLNRFQINGESYLQALRYPGHRRTGDQYIFNLFQCAVLMYYDKFGTHGLELALNRALHWAYSLRLRFARIGWGRIETEAKKHNGLLHCIALAEQPADVAAFVIEKFKVEYQVGKLENLLKNSIMREKND